MTVSRYPLERLLGSLEIGSRAIEKPEARIGAGDHRGQWLSYLMGDGGRHRVPGHQARLALATPAKHRPKQPFVKHRDLIEQHHQNDAARQYPEHPYRIPSRTEALGIGIVA